MTAIIELTVVGKLEYKIKQSFNFMQTRGAKEVGLQMIGDGKGRTGKFFFIG